MKPGNFRMNSRCFGLQMTGWGGLQALRRLLLSRLVVLRALVEERALIFPCRNDRGHGRILSIVSLAKERARVMGVSSSQSGRGVAQIGKEKAQDRQVAHFVARKRKGMNAKNQEPSLSALLIQSSVF
jgi:hypothetical protein